MREARQPPYTNRGVICTEEAEKKECLTAVIDWCQVTFKDVTPRQIVEEVLRIPYVLMYSDRRSGIKGGYKSMICFDNIRILEPSGGNRENGYQLLMSGQGCRNYEVFLQANEETWFDFLERAEKYGSNFPRIDLAIDDHKTYFKIARLTKMAENKQVICNMHIGSKQGSFELKNNKRRGQTINFGSGSSEFFLTCYEKGYEQAAKLGLSEDEIDKNWNRYELKFRQKKACLIVKELIKHREVYTVAMETLNASIRFIVEPEKPDKNKRRWPTWKPWAWFMRDVGKIKLSIQPKTKDYYERLNWLQTAVAPTLWVYTEIDRKLGMHKVQDILDNAKLSSKHRQMLEGYINQLQAQALLSNDEERKKELERIIQDKKEGWMVYEDLGDIGLQRIGCPFPF